MVMYTYAFFHLCTCIYILMCEYIHSIQIPACMFILYVCYIYIYCKNNLCSICLYTVYRYHVHACINIYIYIYVYISMDSINKLIQISLDIYIYINYYINI